MTGALTGAQQALPAALAAARAQDLDTLRGLVDWPLSGAAALGRRLLRAGPGQRAEVAAAGLAEFDAAAGRPDLVREILVGVVPWFAAARDIRRAQGRDRDAAFAALQLLAPPDGLTGAHRARFDELRSRAARLREVYLVATETGALPVGFAPDTGQLVLVLPTAGIHPTTAPAGDTPEPFAALTGAASRQLGLVTGAQAGRLGVDGPMLARYRDEELLTELGPDVHRVAALRATETYAYPYASWLAISPHVFAWERPAQPNQDAVLSHESAASLHNIGRIGLRWSVFTAPQALAEQAGARIHVGRLAPDEVEVVEGVPVTTPARTIADLLLDGVNDEDLSRVIEDAVRPDLVELGALHRRLVGLAVPGRIPSEGRLFLEYYTPNLTPETLSPRNRTAIAELRAS